MFIVSSFETRYNTERKYHEIVSAEETRCPFCSGILKYRNSKPRRTLDELSNITIYLLRRFWCDGCRHLHTEIPDFIQPYRHYGSSVIQDVLDGGGDACAADDSTIRRWRNDFKEAEADIEQRLKSIYAIGTGSHAPLTTRKKTLGSLMKAEPHWLLFVMKLLICHGHRLCTRFAFCPEPPPDKVNVTVNPIGKGGFVNDKTKEDTG